MDHFGSAKWREILLLTASRLPDATRFLTLFEGVLRDLITHRVGLVGLLRLIERRAAASQAAYSQPATRLYYFHAWARSLGSKMPLLNRARNLARRLARDLDLDLKLKLNLTLDRVVDLALNLAHGTSIELLMQGYLPAEIELELVHAQLRRDARNLSREMRSLLDQCHRWGWVELYERLVDLEMPPAGTRGEAWEQFLIGFRTAVESHGEPQRHAQLQAEAEEVAEEGRMCCAGIRYDDLRALETYLRGTTLFYDCLQLAYTPYRDGFEDRILAPPP